MWKLLILGDGNFYLLIGALLLQSLLGTWVIALWNLIWERDKCTVNDLTYSFMERMFLCLKASCPLPTHQLFLNIRFHKSIDKPIGAYMHWILSHIYKKYKLLLNNNGQKNCVTKALFDSQFHHMREEHEA